MNRLWPPSIVIVFLLVLASSGCRRELPELGQVSGFELVDQQSQPVSDAVLRGQVWVASFMFTRCPTVCPRMMEAMREVQQRAAARSVPLRLVTFSVDPEHDTPAVLTDFAAKYGADLATWSFLTGSPETIEATATAFKVAVEGSADAGADHYGILHGAHVVLVDRQLRLRGYYRVREPGERDRLLRDARSLR